MDIKLKALIEFVHKQKDKATESETEFKEDDFGYAYNKGKQSMCLDIIIEAERLIFETKL